MYQFTDKGGNDVCLRPEGTAGVVRAFIQAKLDRQQGHHYRFFYFGSMFRYERPQKGRLRQFHQFGVESFGEAGVEEDFTLIQMLCDIFNTLKINYRIKINSLGCQECMPPYRENLIKSLHSIKDELCSDCQRRIDTNPIRVLDCKNSNCQKLLKDAPRLNSSLCQSCNSNFERLKKLLDQSNIEYEVDSNLVRGLDYYSGTAFEFISDDIGSQSAIAGGGRYDRLVEFLDGRPTPGIGFAIGLERIMELVQMPENKRDGWYLGSMIPEGVELLFKLAHKQREAGEKAIVEYTPKGLKAHLKGADKTQARYCAILGEDELENGTIWIKDLVKKEERVIPLKDI